MDEAAEIYEQVKRWREAADAENAACDQLKAARDEVDRLYRVVWGPGGLHDAAVNAYGALHALVVRGGNGEKTKET